MNSTLELLLVIGTFLAVIVALCAPWIVNWLNNQPRNSEIKTVGISIIDQSNNDYEEREENTLHVGRLILKNEGYHIAQSVEAYLEKIEFEGKPRENFFPVPLTWTHGQLNKNGLTVRNIYRHQIVYLDIFNYFFDPNIVGDRQAKFALGLGRDFENLSTMNVGKSDIYLKLYQESGQVVDIHLIVTWDKDVPKMIIG